MGRRAMRERVLSKEHIGKAMPLMGYLEASVLRLFLSGKYFESFVAGAFKQKLTAAFTFTRRGDSHHPLCAAAPKSLEHYYSAPPIACTTIQPERARPSAVLT